MGVAASALEDCRGDSRALARAPSHCGILLIVLAPTRNSAPPPNNADLEAPHWHVFELKDRSCACEDLLGLFFEGSHMRATSLDTATLHELPWKRKLVGPCEAWM